MTDAARRLATSFALVALVATTPGCSDGGTLPPPDAGEPGYDLRLRGGSDRTAPRMEVLELVIDIEREEGGYEGPVTFSAEAPAGIVVIFRPTTVLNSNSTDVLVVADGTVEPRLHQVAIHGTAPERPDQVVVLNFTVTP